MSPSLWRFRQGFFRKVCGYRFVQTRPMIEMAFNYMLARTEPAGVEEASAKLLEDILSGVEDTGDALELAVLSRTRPTFSVMEELL